jgi:ferrochelatase
MGETVGVLVMAYGTPPTPNDVEAYYTHVRRGRPPTPELLADLQRRYAAIGGTSPLLDVTRRQAAGLQSELGDGFRVELGMKHAPPFIEDGVAALETAGVTRAVGLVLAPHYSALSVGEYATRAQGVDVVEHWWDAPGYLDLLADAVKRGLDTLPEGSEVVFTAHSLPVRILESGDPYPDQLRATAEAVAARAGLARWSLAWQSAGRTPDPWLGPDILEVLDDRAAAGRAGLLVCPCGFVSEHLEILYDLDVEARARAEALSLPMARTAMPNDDPAFLRTLADVVRARLASPGLSSRAT